jgi:hypothetical protein
MRRSLRANELLQLSGDLWSCAGCAGAARWLARS